MARYVEVFPVDANLYSNKLIFLWQKIYRLIIIRKGVPELQGPALVCLSDIDKKCIGLPHGPKS